MRALTFCPKKLNAHWHQLPQKFSLALAYMMAKSALNSCFSQLVVSVAFADITYMAMESYVQLVVMEKVSWKEYFKGISG